MRRFHSIFFAKIIHQTVVVAAISLVAANIDTVHAQTLLKATGTIYESSQNTQNRSAANLFDGTPVFGSNTGNGTIAGNTANDLWDGFNNNATTAPTNNDYAPVLAFDLGSTFRVTGAGYAQVVIAGNAGKNFAGTINIYTLTLAQYNAYITAAPLQASFNAASGATAGSGRLVAAPAAGAYGTMQTLTLTNTANDNYTQYALSAPLISEYFVLQFFNSDPTAGTAVGNFIGGEEFEFIGSAVPEPTSFVLLGMGAVAMACCVRYRSRASLAA